MFVHIFSIDSDPSVETSVLSQLSQQSGSVTVIFIVDSVEVDFATQSIFRICKNLNLETRIIEAKPEKNQRTVKISERLYETLIELKPKIAHAHTPKVSQYLLGAAKKYRKENTETTLRLVSTYYGPPPENKWTEKITSKIYEAFYLRWILPAFDKVLTVCTSDRNILIDHGLHPLTVEVHLGGIDRTKVTLEDRVGASRVVREKWNLKKRSIPENSFLIGYVGPITNEKRLDRVLSVASFLEDYHPELPQWNLLVFGNTGGNGGERKSARKVAEKLAKKLQINHRVKWMESDLSKEKMVGLDLLISIPDTERSPSQLIEAGWAATPVFVTNVSGNLDLVPSEGFGFHVAPETKDLRIADLLSNVIKSQPLREKVARAFQKRVETEFSGAKWRERLNRIYRTLEDR